MAAIAAANIQSPLPGEALDIGSGKGELIGAIRTRFGLRTTACDYTDTLMNDSTQRVDIVDLNAGKLPYSDGRFCLVTCVETIEHLEQTRSLLREIYRVLEPGGLARYYHAQYSEFAFAPALPHDRFFQSLRPTPDWRSTCLQSGRTHQSDQLFLSRPCFARNRLRRSPAECRPLPAPLLAAVRYPFSANESRSPLLLATREK